jgi:Na+-driven multidrug efflux pump
MLFNRIKTGFFLNVLIYLIVTIALASSLQPILNYLIEDEILRDKSSDYIFLELIASFFSSIFKYVLVI